MKAKGFHDWWTDPKRPSYDSPYEYAQAAFAAGPIFGSSLARNKVRCPAKEEGCPLYESLKPAKRRRRRKRT